MSKFFTITFQRGDITGTTRERGKNAPMSTCRMTDNGAVVTITPSAEGNLVPLLMLHETMHVLTQKMRDGGFDDNA